MAGVVCSCTKKENMICPAFLKPGDKVAIMAPSFFKEDSVAIAAAELLKEYGLQTEFREGYAHVFPEGAEPPFCYSGSYEERLAELRRVMEDDSVKAVICTRGGYGALHLIQALEPEYFRSHPKWIVGYSDISYILVAEAVSGVMGIHGSMAADLVSGGLQEEGNAIMLGLLMCNVPEYDLPAHEYNVEGSASGVLVGGNLESIATMVGSDYDFTKLDNYILFIEELNERIYDIDRALNVILQHPEGLRGVVVCDFTDCELLPYYPQVEDVLNQYLSKLGVPVCYGLHAGHGSQNLPLIEGATLEMNVTEGGASLRFKIPTD